MKHIFCILLITSVLTSCNSLKKIVFSGDEWTLYPTVQMVKNEESGDIFDLKGLFDDYLPEYQIIDNKDSLLKNVAVAKYAKSIFSDLHISNKDTVLFFITGKILVYSSDNYDVTDIDYCFEPKQENPKEFIRENTTVGEIKDSYFFRKIIVNKKQHRVINIDTFKDKKNRWLSMAYLNEMETRRNSKIRPRVWTAMFIDLSKFENLLTVAEIINGTDKITIENFLKKR